VTRLRFSVLLLLTPFPPPPPSFSASFFFCGPIGTRGVHDPPSSGIFFISLRSLLSQPRPWISPFSQSPHTVSCVYSLAFTPTRCIRRFYGRSWRPPVKTSFRSTPCPASITSLMIFLRHPQELILDSVRAYLIMPFLGFSVLSNQCA